MPNVPLDSIGQPLKFVRVPIDIHPLDNSHGAGVMELLRNPPSAATFNDEQDWYDHWWKMLINAAVISE